MEQLFEIYETDDYGRPQTTLGTVYAHSPDQAREFAAKYFNNKEIVTTGYYGARLPEASIKLEELEKFHSRKLRQAQWDLERFKNKIEL